MPWQDAARRAARQVAGQAVPVRHAAAVLVDQLLHGEARGGQLHAGLPDAAGHGVAAQARPPVAAVAVPPGAAALDQLAVEFETQWTVMTANERRVVAALSAGVSPLSRDGRDLGLKRPSSAQKSLESLLRRGIAEREDDGVRIVDPLLARWVTELRGR